VTIPTPEGVTMRPLGLDYTAVLLAGMAAGVDLPMLVDLLPSIEAAIINNEPEGGEDGD
jgi:hypothetical protein